MGAVDRVCGRTRGNIRDVRVKAVLLAAGRGTRLAPLTTTAPKILLSVAGEPLLARQLRYLAMQGISEVLLNLHHHANLVDDYLATSGLPVAVTVYDEPELRGTAGALFPMRERLDAGRFVVLYGDVVTDHDLRAFKRESRGIATLAYYVASDVRGKGLLDLGLDERVRHFVEKPRGQQSGCVNAGIYALDPAIFEFIPEFGDFGFDVWPRVLAAGEVIYGSPIDGYLLDMGSPDALAQLRRDIEARLIAW
jgi:mannose-1-phosphate guanylyltransferase